MHLKRLGSPGFGGIAAKALQRLVKALDKEIAALEKAFAQEVAKTSLAGAHEL